MSFKNSIILFGLFLVLAGCSDTNEILNIEAGNSYEWQRYMSEEEFNKVEIGMSYMEVVKIAKGAGEEINLNTYVWPDEIVLTHAYELKFEADKLVEKNVVERRGNSMRELDTEDKQAE